MKAVHSPETSTSILAIIFQKNSAKTYNGVDQRFLEYFYATCLKQFGLMTQTLLIRGRSQTTTCRFCSI